VDKYEYKHLVEQIQSLIDQGKYAEAATIADKIDWRRVRSVMTLGTISDLYKINGRYEDARDIMLLAYDRKPGNRQICYSLCELYVKTGEPVEAAEFYKEFEKLAPNDPGRYILKYKLYDAYDVSLDEKIEVLEKLKAEDYQEKWMYELASLYHRRGLGTKCVEVCDEIILWFGTGKYVNMAMELKMLHEPLTAEQQRKYESRGQAGAREYAQQPTYAQQPAYVQEAPHVEPAAEQANAQGEELPVSEQQTTILPHLGEVPVRRNTHEWKASEVEQANAEQFGATRVFNAEEVRRQLKGQPEGQDDYDIQVKTVDVGQYNTMNLQAELAEGLKEILGEQGDAQQAREATPDPAEALYHTKAMEVTSDSGPLDLPLMEAVNSEELEEETDEPEKDEQKAPENVENSEVFFEAPGEMYQDEFGYFHEAKEIKRREDNEKEGTPKESILEKEAMKAQPPEPMAKVLTQEADGQLKLVIPESKNLEKQITGQLSIEDIRAEWERMKLESQAKQEEEVRQQVLRQTGRMFTEFEEAIRDNILRQMEDKMDPETFPDVPMAEESVAEEPITEEPVAGEPISEEIAAEETEEEKPVAEEAVAKEPAADEAEEEKPAEEAVAEETVEEKPAEEAVAKEPVVEEAEEEKPAAEEAVAKEPTAEETVVEEPVADDSAEEKSAAEVELASEWDMEGIGEEIHEFPVVTKVAETVIRQEAEAVLDEKEETPVRAMPEELREDDFSWGEEAEESFEEEAENFEEAEEVKETKETNMFHRRNVVEADQEELEDAGFDFESILGDEVVEETETEPERERRFSSDDEDVVNDFAEEDEAEEETEDHAEPSAEPEAKEESAAKESDAKTRKLTPDEEKWYDPWIRDDADREQFAKAIDGISMAPYVGNVIIAGEEGLNTVELAKKMVYEIKTSDSNFSGKVAKVPGSALNKKDVGQLLDGLKNGALIVENANSMPEKAIQDLHKNLQRENWGIIVILLDTKKNAKKFLKAHEYLRPLFNVWLEVKPMSNDALAEFARQYAREQEYSIDDLGTLALHMKIDEMQTARHAVNTEDVKEMMDDAIYSASRKTLGHFLDIIFGRRYDDEDMIIITEKDFQ